MANKEWLKVPESDMRGDEPDLHPIEVRLLFNNPKVKEGVEGPHGTFTSIVYGVEYEGVEYSLSASETLNKIIQETGATKDTLLKLRKDRIGDGNKEIRWKAWHASGPMDATKTKAGQAAANTGNGTKAAPTNASQPVTAAPAQQAQPNADLYYYPRKDQPGYLELAHAVNADKLAVFTDAHIQVTEAYPEQEAEWRRTVAVHLSIGTDMKMYHLWDDKKRQVLAPVPEPTPEPSEREQVVLDIEMAGFPETLFGAIADGDDAIKDASVVIERVKAFGYSTVPKSDTEVWLTVAHLVWGYEDALTEGYNERNAMLLVAGRAGLPEEVLTLPKE